MPVRYIPKGYQHVTPYLTVRGASEAIRFYQDAFGAREIQRFEQDGNVAHAEIEIADCKIMLGEENPQWGAKSPKSLGGSPVGIHLYVEDVDKAFAKALKTGATQLHPLTNQFYGDRSGTVVDPFGHTWTLSTHVEDVEPNELQRRFTDFMARVAQTPEHVNA